MPLPKPFHRKTSSTSNPQVVDDRRYDRPLNRLGIRRNPSSRPSAAQDKDKPLPDVPRDTHVEITRQAQDFEPSTSTTPSTATPEMNSVRYSLTAPLLPALPQSQDGDGEDKGQEKAMEDSSATSRRRSQFWRTPTMPWPPSRRNINDSLVTPEEPRPKRDPLDQSKSAISAASSTSPSPSPSLSSIVSWWKDRQNTKKLENRLKEQDKRAEEMIARYGRWEGSETERHDDKW